MEIGELVERLAAMRRQGPPGAMTVVFGMIFCDEIGDRSHDIAKEYTERWKSDRTAYPLKRNAKKLNATPIQDGRKLTLFATVDPALKHRWRTP